MLFTFTFTLFIEMSKVLDILEGFANMHGFTYLRLDGSTKIEKRQIIVERFNRDPRIFLFLSTTRSGGFGINLTGADTVVFYDSDWNPAVDAQAQDRCHRIGQTKPVTIYRLITESTVEENILKKAKQKKSLNRIVIKDGSFTTDFLTGLNLTSLIKKDALKKDIVARSWLDDVNNNSNDGDEPEGEGEGEGETGSDDVNMKMLESMTLKEEDDNGQFLAQNEEEMEMREDFGDENADEKMTSSPSLMSSISGNDKAGLEMLNDVDADADDGMMADALNSVKYKKYFYLYYYIILFFF